MQADWQDAQEAACSLSQHKKAPDQLEPLTEMVQRRTHFSYSDAAGMLSENINLNDKLSQRLERAEAEGSQGRDVRRAHQPQLTHFSQVKASLKSSYEAKQDMLKELMKKLHDIGAQTDANAEAHPRERLDQLHMVLPQNRGRRNQLEKQLTFYEAEMDALQKKLRKMERDYYQTREKVVSARAGLCAVRRLAKENSGERRLYRRELAYMEVEYLRSMSDKALGGRRLARTDNEHLLEVLRLSEDPKRPERKIQFSIAVYQHLRERIRQNIIRTADPVEAIEQMKIELNHLTEELTAREQKLAISSKSAAKII